MPRTSLAWKAQKKAEETGWVHPAVRPKEPEPTPSPTGRISTGYRYRQEAIAEGKVEPKPGEIKPKEFAPKEIQEKSFRDVRTVLTSPYYRTVEKARYAQSQILLRKQLERVPFGYTLKETPEGYEVQKTSPEFIERHRGKLIPTFGVTPKQKAASEIISKLTGWTPEKLAYEATRYTPYEQKIRMYERMPPVIREIHATSQAAAAIVAFPVTLPATLIGKPFPETRIAPTGAIGATISDVLSGSGREWEYIRKHPVGGVAATVGEFLGGYGISPIFKPFGKVARTGIKGIIKRVPSVYEKAVGVFPRISRVGETTFAKHLYRWSAKGWKPGIRLAPGTTKISERITTKGFESIFKKVPYKRGERIWMPPSQYKTAQLQLTKMLSQKGFKIDFPTVKTVEGGARTIGTMRYERHLLRGVFKPKIDRYGYFAQYHKPISQITRMYWKPSKSIYRGFTRRIGERTWVGDTRIITTKATGIIPTKGKIPVKFPWTEKQFIDITIKDMTKPIVRAKIYTGIDKTIYVGTELKDIFMKPEKVISAFRGKPQETLRGFVSPLPKKWIQKISTRRIPGFLSVGELRKLETIYRPRPSFAPTQIGTIPGAITVPSGFAVSPITPLAYAYFGITVGALAKARKHELKRITVPSTIQKRQPVSGYLSIPKSLTLTAPISASMMESLQIQDVKPISITTTVPKIDYRKITTTVPKQPQLFFTPSTSTILIPPFFPKVRLGGRGIGSWLSGKDIAKYRFREFDIGSLLGFTTKRKAKRKTTKKRRKR